MSSGRLLRGLAVNLLFALLHGALGVISRSWWYVTLSAYYTVLAVVRFSLLRIRHKTVQEGADERFAEKCTGWLFLLLALCLQGTVIMTVAGDRGTQQHMIIMIAMAAWVFTRIALAIIYMAQKRRMQTSVMRALRNLSLAEAFVSLFSLQRAMLVSFPGMSLPDIRLMNALTGAGVCVLIFLLGLNLIGGKRTVMAKSKLVQANEKVAETVVKGYKTVENAIVNGYKTVENGVTGAYEKIEDKFIDRYLTREGETLEEAKARLKKTK